MHQLRHPIEAVASTSKHGTVSTPANDLKDAVLLEPNRKLRPRRKAASAVTYPISRTEETDGESTDEYTPNPAKTGTKLDSKKMPSVSQIAAQRESMTHPNPTHDPPNHWSLQQKRKLQNHQNQILSTNERVTYTSKLLRYQKGLNYVALNVPHVIIELGVKRNETNITKQFMVY